MSLLQELEQSIHSDAPIYMEFLYRYNPKKKQVFAFYEGDEDSSFYYHIIRDYIDEDCELEEIVAGCKNNVLKLQREFDWEVYNNKQIAFFVDRDLSFWLGDLYQYEDNIFVTDEYSVENYIANTQGFKAWIIHFEGFSRARKQEIDQMISEFEINIVKFRSKMMPIMAKAVVAKRHNKSISLSEFKITRDKNICFVFKNGHIDFEIRYDNNIAEKWGLTSENDEEINKQIEQFKLEKTHYSVRGKWILCFLAELGEYMRLHSNVFAPSLGNQGKTSPTCSVSTNQCLSVLAPYCTKIISPRLTDFFDKTYRKYLIEYGKSTLPRAAREISSLPVLRI